MSTNEPFSPHAYYDCMDLPEPNHNETAPTATHRNVNGQELYRTRYGRTIKKLSRFGYDI